MFQDTNTHFFTRQLRVSMEDDGSYCALYAGSSAYRRKPVASFRDLNLASINRLISSQALIVSRYNLSIHRRRIKTEEKAKVVTVVRGMYLNATLTIKQQDDLNKSFLKTFFLVGWWVVVWCGQDDHPFFQSIHSVK